MAYLKEITTVERFMEQVTDRDPQPIIQVQGFRTDLKNKFIMNIIKNPTGEWELCNFFFEFSFRISQEFDDENRSMRDPEKQFEWNALFEELIIHPKVRLHTLF